MPYRVKVPSDATVRRANETSGTQTGGRRTREASESSRRAGPAGAAGQTSGSPTEMSTTSTATSPAASPRRITNASGDRPAREMARPPASHPSDSACSHPARSRPRPPRPAKET
ncbi:hypothetical protein LIP_1332 [Limnochorda pilosa]|uniref:Uncharacterized protein n=1 Tax=Limnochorda pilosa TaxID=1555112 RepID=A0A0K2SJB0_LIMPI|nr:hypothetical protein LIP_1332 [Limnochorda pilosa]